MPKQTAHDSRLVAGFNTINRMGVSVGLGDVLTSQALWYFECSSHSGTTQPMNDVLDLYAKLIAWLEKAKPKTCVNNNWAAAACHHAMTFYKVEVEPQHLSMLFGNVPQQAALPEAYAKLALHDMVNMHDMSLPVKMQVLHLYKRLMVWLSKDTSASNSYWAAAALQIAMLHYKIPFLPSNLAGHVKVDLLGEHAHDIRQLYSASTSFGSLTRIH
ncbi:hypothetical protein WJX82_002828 [Trebouxia sp. C0006]